MLHRFAANRADLEDIVQETFVRAWRSLGSWQPDKPFKHQRTPFSRLVEPDEKHDLLENIADSPAQRDLSEARFVLSHLPPEDRALLTLLHLEEMPLAEIAAHLGWSRVKAKVKAFRARQRLKSILTQHGYSFT
ncbi:MAG: polymerase sigma-E factor [Verrucomicrobiota bacterium]